MTGARPTIAVIVTFRISNKISRERRPALIGQAGKKHPIYIPHGFMAYCLIMYRDNFTFTFGYYIHNVFWNVRNTALTALCSLKYS